MATWQSKWFRSIVENRRIDPGTNGLCDRRLDVKTNRVFRHVSVVSFKVLQPVNNSRKSCTMLPFDAIMPRAQFSRLRGLSVQIFVA